MLLLQQHVQKPSVIYILHMLLRHMQKPNQGSKRDASKTTLDPQPYLKDIGKGEHFRKGCPLTPTRDSIDYVRPEGCGIVLNVHRHFAVHSDLKQHTKNFVPSKKHICHSDAYKLLSRCVL